MKLVYFGSSALISYYLTGYLIRSNHSVDYLMNLFFKSNNIFDNQLFKNNSDFHNINFETINHTKETNDIFYIPSMPSQGHKSICHGGFTISAIEYLMKSINIVDKDKIINKIYIRYRKPMFVKDKYKVSFFEDNKITNFKINNNKNNELYTEGYFTFKE